MSTEYIHGTSETEQQRLALMNRLINRRCLEAIGLTDEKLVLDVGSGTGLFSRLMADQLPAGSRVIGIERDANQLRVARTLESAGCAVEFRQGHATDLPLDDTEAGHVDLAHARYLLEHVPDPQAVVSEMVRALRPGGRIVLLDDDHEQMRFWPEPEGMAEAWRAYYLSYRSLGHDPLIGRKLAGLIHAAGAIPTRIDHLFYGACAGEDLFAGITDNLIGVMDSARETALATGAVTAGAWDRALDNFRSFCELPNAAVWYVINFAEGYRRQA